jgi:cell division control protein 24
MSEPEFACYGPYCANYLDAITIVNEQMPNLLVSSYTMNQS